MSLEEIIKPDNVLCNAHARSKKHCLEILSELLVRSYPDIANEAIFDKLIERERLGCTSLDQGVAFPHCRVQGLDANTAALIKLSEPVDFDAPDDEPVDIVFGLMVPAELDQTQQADVAMVAELLSDRDIRRRLRAANSSSELFNALLNKPPPTSGEALKSAQGT